MTPIENFDFLVVMVTLMQMAYNLVGNLLFYTNIIPCKFSQDTISSC